MKNVAHKHIARTWFSEDSKIVAQVSYQIGEEGCFQPGITTNVDWSPFDIIDHCNRKATLRKGPSRTSQ